MRPAPGLAALGIALLLLVLLPAPARGQSHGEQVDITATRFPSALVADRVFFIDVDVQNKLGSAQDVQLFAVLYNMTGGSGTCDPTHTNQGLSVFRKAVHLEPFQSVHVDGAQASWRQQVNGSKLDGFGVHEACVWSQGSCPAGGTLLQCFTDTASVQVPVRAGNAPPRVTAQADRERATTADVVTLSATASDPDGDNMTLVWDLGDGSRAEGASLQHRYAQPGVYRATFIAADGFDSTSRSVSIVIDAPGGGGKATPGPALPALLAGLALAARVTRRRGPASPAAP